MLTPEPRRTTFRMDDGVVLAGETWGPGDGPLLVMAHGIGQTRRAWRKTCIALAEKGWRTVAFDERGHGDSGWSLDGDYTIFRYAQDLRAIATAFDELPVVVGASLGAIAALMAQGEAPGPLFRALVLVDNTPRLTPDGVKRIVGLLRHRLREGYPSVEAAADAITAFFPHRSRGEGAQDLAQYLRLGPDNTYRWHWDPRIIMGEKWCNQADHYDRIEAAARHLTLPVLLIRGRFSEIVSEEEVRAFLELVPHAEHADVADARHMVLGDRNDAFARDLFGFLDRLRERQFRPQRERAPLPG